VQISSLSIYASDLVLRNPVHLVAAILGTTSASLPAFKNALVIAINKILSDCAILLSYPSELSQQKIFVSTSKPD
jgi:hypothetical protein